MNEIRAFLKVAFPGTTFFVRKTKKGVSISAYESVDWEVVHKALSYAGLVTNPFPGFDVVKSAW